MNENIYGVLQCNSRLIKNLDDFWTYFKCSCDVGIHALEDIFSRPSCDGRIYDLFDINGVGLYFDPRGKHICALDEAKSIIKNDLFLVSKYNQLSDQTVEYNSYKMSYQHLSAQLMLNILDALYAKTMAYENKQDYAISSHNHDRLYSKAVFHPNPKYQKGTDISTMGILKISTDYLSGDEYGKYDSIYHNPKDYALETREYSINIPKIEIPLPPKPMIGTMKFIGLQTMNALIESNGINVDSANVNPYDSSNKIRNDYDGWVFPNGSTIQNYGNQLSDAARYYSSDGTNIVLPNIQDFVKCGPMLELSTKVSFDQKVTLPEHTHMIEPMKLNGDLSFNANQSELCGTNGNGGKSLFHRGPTEEKVFEVKGVNLLFDQSKLDGVKTTMTGEDPAKEQYPTHNIIPIMIYIGGETREYYESLHDKYMKSLK